MTWGPDDDHAIRRGRGVAWTPFLLAAAVFAGIFAYGAAVYDALPDPVPTHWGPGGTPDAWGEKSFGSVFMGPFIALGTTALMALFAVIAPALTVPPKEPTAWQRYRQEGARRATIEVLGWVALLTALLVGYLSYRGWTTPEHLGMAVPLVLYLLAIVGTMFWPFKRWERWSGDLATANGHHPSAEEDAENRLWLAGGIYNNPDEPRIMVPKREGYGTGLTVNVGHRKGQAVVAVFLGVFVVAPLALIVALG